VKWVWRTCHINKSALLSYIFGILGYMGRIRGPYVPFFERDEATTPHPTPLCLLFIMDDSRQCHLEGSLRV
jgi:hypothetical protein